MLKTLTSLETFHSRDCFLSLPRCASSEIKALRAQASHPLLGRRPLLPLHQNRNDLETYLQRFREAKIVHKRNTRHDCGFCRFTNRYYLSNIKSSVLCFFIVFELHFHLSFYFFPHNHVDYSFFFF